MGKPEPDARMELAGQLTSMRIKRRLNVAQLEGLAGLGHTTVSQALSGSAIPSERTVRRLAEVLRADPAPWLLLRLRALGGSSDVGPPAEDGMVSDIGPRYWGRLVPPRNRRFIGRDDMLRDLRTRLERGPATLLPAPQSLHGLGGIGKTQLAVEFAYRYAQDYDLVWWVNAQEVRFIPTSLAELARTLELPTGGPPEEDAQRAREALRRGSPAARWLVVFDNVEEPQQIAPYLPQGAGHVLITSRNPSWDAFAEPVAVGVFSRAESIELLRRCVPSLDHGQADRIADALGDLPLAVEIAGAWLRESGSPVDFYLEGLRRQVHQLLTLGEVPSYPTSVAAAWNISIARLRQEAPAAVHLLELCAYMAPDGISNRLVYSGTMTRQLAPFAPGEGGSLLVSRAVKAAARYSLVTVDHQDFSLRVHRLVQAVTRAGLEPEAQEMTLHTVHRLLVEARPESGGVDEPENWPQYEDLWAHLTPSMAANCDESDSRELWIDRVRYLCRRGNYRKAVQLGRRIDAEWTVKLGADDPQVRRMRDELSEALRRLDGSNTA